MASSWLLHTLLEILLIWEGVEKSDEKFGTELLRPSPSLGRAPKVQTHISNLVRVQSVLDVRVPGLSEDPPCRNPGQQTPSFTPSPPTPQERRFCRSHLVCVPVFLVRGLETSRVLCEKDPGRAGEKPNRSKEDFSRLGPLNKVTLTNPVAWPKETGDGFLSSTIYCRRNW